MFYFTHSQDSSSLNSVVKLTNIINFKLFFSSACGIYFGVSEEDAEGGGPNLCPPTVSASARIGDFNKGKV